MPELLREAHAQGLDEQCAPFLAAYRLDCQNALAWHREAGRALTAEGLETDVLHERIGVRIRRGRQRLRTALLFQLGKQNDFRDQG